MNLWVWQLIDSNFPSGGFAHSGGLEASVHHGQVADAEGVRAFARQTLAQAGRSALPLVTAAHRQPERFAELDALSDVFLSNPIANRASRAQGRALVTSAARSFPETPVRSVEERVRREQLAAHHAPTLGVVLNALGVTLADTQRAFLYITLRGVVTAAVRLGLTGSYEAQEIQATIAGDIDSVIHRCGQLTPSEIAQTAPLIDLFQSTHDRLYSRLFQS
jgi:urease accessory protein